MNSVVGTNSTGQRRYRSWPEALKREIVAASLVPGASVSVIARQYDVNVNQVFAWRKLYRETAHISTAPALVPLIIASDPSRAVSRAPDPGSPIEIVLNQGYRVRVGDGFDGGALCRVLDVLEARR